jgi:hypothetical protein
MTAAFADQFHPPPDNIRQRHALAKIFDKFGRHRHNSKLRLVGQQKGFSDGVTVRQQPWVTDNINPGVKTTKFGQGRLIWQQASMIRMPQNCNGYRNE